MKVQHSAQVRKFHKMHTGYLRSAFNFTTFSNSIYVLKQILIKDMIIIAEKQLYTANIP